MPLLNIRVGPSTDWGLIGVLEYGDEVIPFGRLANSTWVLINWGGRRAWLAAWLVEWHPGFDLDTLPIILPPPTPTPTPTLTPSPTSTPTNSATPTNTPGPFTPTATLQTPTDPNPTLIPTKTLIPSATNTSTPAPGAITSPSDEQDDASFQLPPQISRVLSSPVLLGSLGMLAVLIAGYVWRRRRGQKELYRYANGFGLQSCPVCQQGSLQLEEHVQRTMSIPVVTRSVRCDNCRSILRQMRPGVWRYAIDPLVNPGLADKYNGKLLSDAELLAFKEKAKAFEPTALSHGTGEEASPEFQDVMEHLEALEADVIAAQEEAQNDSDHQDDDTGSTSDDNASTERKSTEADSETAEK